jgi:predicted Zn-dependent protease
MKQKYRSIILSAFLAFITCFGFMPNTACSAPEIQPGTFIIDDETESAFLQWLTDIFSVFDMKGYQPKVYLLVDPDINAGATVGGQIIIYTGLIIDCKNVGELLGVLAHEVGHVAGGHVAKMDSAEEQALIPSVAAVVLGGVASLATGNPAPLIAGASGGSTFYQRLLLQYSRGLEASADSAALTALEKLNWPATGLLTFLKRLESKMFVKSSHLDPYTLTHPATSERVSIVQDYVVKHPITTQKIPEKYEQQFQRIKAKLIGFFKNPQETLRIYTIFDKSIPARYARAIALYKTCKNAQVQQGLQILDGLIAENPQDPYFPEVKGQILFETGKIKEAVAAYRDVVTLRPHSALLKILLAQSLIESNDTNVLPEVISALTDVIKVNEDNRQTQNNIYAWRLLAIAYGRKGDQGLAEWCLAEEAWLQGDKKTAIGKAKIAHKHVTSSQAKARLSDILKQVNQDGDSKSGITNVLPISQLD